MMRHPAQARYYLDSLSTGAGVAVARVGADGTAELALYERTADGFHMIGDGWGEKHTDSAGLARDYDDVLPVYHPRTTSSGDRP